MTERFELNKSTVMSSHIICPYTFSHSCSWTFLSFDTVYNLGLLYKLYTRMFKYTACNYKTL